MRSLLIASWKLVNHNKILPCAVEAIIQPIYVNARIEIEGVGQLAARKYKKIECYHT